MKILTFCRSFANAFLVETKGGWVLVDSGYDGGAKAFWRFLAKQGLRPEDIKAALITHSHADHVGFLKEILDLSHAEVFCHSDHAHVLERGLADYTGIAASSRMMKAVLPHSTKGGGTNNAFDPLDEAQMALLHFVDTEEGAKLLKDKYGIEAVLTHGHTLSCVSYVLDDVAFVGDVAMNIPLTPHLVPFIVSDRAGLLAAWDKLAARPLTLYLGHGNPIPSAKLLDERGYLENVTIYEVKHG